MIGYPVSCPGPCQVILPPRSTSMTGAPGSPNGRSDTAVRLPAVYTGSCSSSRQLSGTSSATRRACTRRCRSQASRYSTGWRRTQSRQAHSLFPAYARPGQGLAGSAQRRRSRRSRAASRSRQEDNEVVIDKAELRRMSRPNAASWPSCSPNSTAWTAAPTPPRQLRLRPGEAPGEPDPNRADPFDRPGAAPRAAAGAAGRGGLLRGPGRLDRAARRHPAAPFRRASLACRLGELRRVPARGVRGDGVGDLAGTAGADPAADAHRHHALLRRLVRRRHVAGDERLRGSACCPRSSPSLPLAFLAFAGARRLLRATVAARILAGRPRRRHGQRFRLPAADRRAEAWRPGRYRGAGAARASPCAARRWPATVSTSPCPARRRRARAARRPD